MSSHDDNAEERSFLQWILVAFLVLLFLGIVTSAMGIPLSDPATCTVLCG